MVPIIKNVTRINKIMANCILVLSDDLEPNFNEIFSGRKSYRVLMSANINIKMPHKVKINENNDIGLIRPETCFHDTILYWSDGNDSTYE